MTKIDSTKLTAIFRSLTGDQVKSTATNSNKTHSTPSVNIEYNSRASKEKLRIKIATRLNKINRDDPEYQKKSAGIVIREILLWEFGEDFINHTEFKNLSTLVLSQIKDNEALNRYLEKLVDSSFK